MAASARIQEFRRNDPEEVGRRLLRTSGSPSGSRSVHAGLRPCYRPSAQALHVLCGRVRKAKRPTDPDSRLVDEPGQHEFLEVRLPGDTIVPHKVAGLALSACCLGGRHAVSVEVAKLRSGDEELFNECVVMRAGCGVKLLGRRTRAELAIGGRTEAPPMRNVRRAHRSL